MALSEPEVFELADRALARVVMSDPAGAVGHDAAGELRHPGADRSPRPCGN